MLQEHVKLEVVLQSIWDDFQKHPIDKSLVSFMKQLTVCIEARGDQILNF